MNQAAFFDLDGTIITRNSASLWMMSEWRKGRLSLYLVARGSLYVLAYKLGVIDMEQAMNEALQTVAGMEEEALRLRTHQWVDERVMRFVAPGARVALDRHRTQGHRLVLLTSASPYESEAISERLGLDDFLSTRYEVHDGRMTGKVAPPICYGTGKIHWAKQYADAHDIDLKESWFYSDSITDLPMLQEVGHPVVVNPDLRLKRKAAKIGWPVEHW